MGKIRVKTIGAPEIEEEEKRRAKKKKEEKKLAKAPGMKGGERVVSVGPSEEELARLSDVGSQLSEERQPVVGQSVTDKQRTGKPQTENRKRKTDNRRSRGKKYQSVMTQIDRNRTYALPDALALLRKVKLAKFDETVELHINTTEAGINGTVKLPHGTGKELKIAVASNELLQEIEKGKVNFDVLIASPDMMPSLAKVARILGPRGLMPNPKNGTISQDPESALKKFQGGQINFKTESKIPVIHLSVGKTSFEDEKLSENIKTVLSAIRKDRIRNITLKNTMSPGIRLQV